MKQAAAVALIVSLVACTATKHSVSPTDSSSPSPSTSAALGSANKIPQSPDEKGKTFVLDLTWISGDVGWALLSAPCKSARCPEIKRTDDGGRTWTSLPSPPGTIHTDLIDCEKAPCINAIRFATSQIGYLFGGAFYVTRDGGQTWTAEKSQLVEALEPVGGSVVRMVFDHAGCPGPCERSVQVATAGSRSWKTVLRVSVDMLAGDSRASTSQLIRPDSRVIYIPIYGDQAAGAGTQHAVVLRSLDAGATWTKLADPCGVVHGQTFDAVDMDAATGEYVSVICVPRGGQGPGQFLLTSTNSGSTWSARKPIPVWAGEIAAVTSSRLVVATQGTTGSGSFVYRLAITQDAGLHWSTIIRDREPVYSVPGSWLGFESATFGRWIADPTGIWTTRNGGVSWSRAAVG